MGEAEVPYCFIDRFCADAAGKIMVRALLDELQTALAAAFSVNLQTVLQQTYRSVRANLSEIEKTQFYNRYVKPLKISFSEDGEAIIMLGQ